MGFGGNIEVANFGESCFEDFTECPIPKASFSFLTAILALLLLELKTGCASLNVNHTSSISRDDISTPATRCATWENLLDRLRVNGDVEARKSQTRWNILHHLGGNGPWIKMSEDDETAQNVSPPLGCFIDQVHMVCDWKHTSAPTVPPLS